MRVDTPVSLVDIAPTILAQLRAPIPSSMAGLDLTPLWSGGQAARQEPGVDAYRERFLYGEAGGGLTYDLVMPGMFPVYSAVRLGRFKMIHDSKADAFVLYDLDADPGELRDASAEHPEIAARLAAELKARHRGIRGGAVGDTRVELDPEEVERLRALGYAVP